METQEEYQLHTESQKNLEFKLVKHKMNIYINIHVHIHIDR